MTRHAVSADKTFFLEIFEDSHLLCHRGRPVRRAHTVNLQNVDVVGIEFFEKSLEDDIGVRAFGFGNTARQIPDFGDERIVFTRDVLKSCGQKGMRPVEVGAVDKR